MTSQTHPQEVPELVERLRNAHDVYDSLRIYVAQGSLADLECDQSQEAIKAAIDALSTDQRTGQEVALAKAIDERLWKVSGSKKPADLISALYDIEALVKAALTKAAHPVEASDEQDQRETVPDLVSRLSDMLGDGTDFDNYTFSIKRGNLRRLLKALQQSQSTPGDLDGDLREADAEVERILALSDEEILAEANASDVAWARGFKQGLAMGQKAATPAPVAQEGELRAAARDVVANYPVAAGTSKGMTDGDGPGYGSIKRLAAALAASPVPVDASGVRSALEASQRILRASFIGKGSIGGSCLCGTKWLGDAEEHKPGCQIAVNAAALHAAPAAGERVQ